jgi:hypothetical protein
VKKIFSILINNTQNNFFIFFILLFVFLFYLFVFSMTLIAIMCIFFALEKGLVSKTMPILQGMCERD